MDVNIMAGGRVGQPGLARCTPAVGKVGRLAGRWRNCCCNNAPPSRDHGRCPRQRVTKFRKPVRRNKTRKARSSTACGWMRAERKGQERLTNPPFFPEQMWGKIAANPSSRFTGRCQFQQQIRPSVHPLGVVGQGGTVTTDGPFSRTTSSFQVPLLVIVF